MGGPACKEKVAADQVERGAVIHGTLQQREAVHLFFPLPAAPGQAKADPPLIGGHLWIGSLWARMVLDGEDEPGVQPPGQQRRSASPLNEACHHVYRARNRVERLMSRLKQFRRVATRYDQIAASFLAFVELAALRIWTKYVLAAWAARTWYACGRCSMMPAQRECSSSLFSQSPRPWDRAARLQRRLRRPPPACTEGALAEHDPAPAHLRRPGSCQLTCKPPDPRLLRRALHIIEHVKKVFHPDMHPVRLHRRLLRPTAHPLGSRIHHIRSGRADSEQPCVRQIEGGSKAFSSSVGQRSLLRS